MPIYNIPQPDRGGRGAARIPDPTLDRKAKQAELQTKLGIASGALGLAGSVLNVIDHYQQENKRAQEKEQKIKDGRALLNAKLAVDDMMHSGATELQDKVMSSHGLSDTEGFDLAVDESLLPKVQEYGQRLADATREVFKAKRVGDFMESANEVVKNAIQADDPTGIDDVLFGIDNHPDLNDQQRQGVKSKLGEMASNRLTQLFETDFVTAMEYVNSGAATKIMTPEQVQGIRSLAIGTATDRMGQWNMELDKASKSPNPFAFEETAGRLLDEADAMAPLLGPSFRMQADGLQAQYDAQHAESKLSAAIALGVEGGEELPPNLSSGMLDKTAQIHYNNTVVMGADTTTREGVMSRVEAAMDHVNIFGENASKDALNLVDELLAQPNGPAAVGALLQRRPELSRVAGSVLNDSLRSAFRRTIRGQVAARGTAQGAGGSGLAAPDKALVDRAITDGNFELATALSGLTTYDYDAMVGKVNAGSDTAAPTDFAGAIRANLTRNVERYMSIAGEFVGMNPEDSEDALIEIGNRIAPDVAGLMLASPGTTAQDAIDQLFAIEMGNWEANVMTGNKLRLKQFGDDPELSNAYRVLQLELESGTLRDYVGGIEQADTMVERNVPLAATLSNPAGWVVGLGEMYRERIVKDKFGMDKRMFRPEVVSARRMPDGTFEVMLRSKSGGVVKIDRNLDLSNARLKELQAGVEGMVDPRALPRGLVRAADNVGRDKAEDSTKALLGRFLLDGVDVTMHRAIVQEVFGQQERTNVASDPRPTMWKPSAQFEDVAVKLRRGQVVPRGKVWAAANELDAYEKEVEKRWWDAQQSDMGEFDKALFDANHEQLVGQIGALKEDMRQGKLRDIARRYMGVDPGYEKTNMGFRQQYSVRLREDAVGEYVGWLNATGADPTERTSNLRLEEQMSKWVKSTEGVEWLAKPRSERRKYRPFNTKGAPATWELERKANGWRQTFGPFWMAPQPGQAEPYGAGLEEVRVGMGGVFRGGDGKWVLKEMYEEGAFDSLFKLWFGDASPSEVLED